MSGESMSFPDEDGNEWALRPEGTPGVYTLYEVVGAGQDREVGQVRAVPKTKVVLPGVVTPPMVFFARGKGQVLESQFDKPGAAVKWIVTKYGGGA